MGGRTQVNKPHKTCFSSKSSLKLHKTSLKDRHHVAHSACQGARAVRIQRSVMVRNQKKDATLNAKRFQCGSTSPPRVIVLFGLSANVDLDSLRSDLLALLSSQSSDDLFPNDNLFPTAVSSKDKMRTTVLKAPHGDLLSCMEMAKVADLIAFVASANSSHEEGSSAYIDSFGAQCLSVSRAIGFRSTVVFIRDLPTDLKRRHASKKCCTSRLGSEFHESKFYPADTEDELLEFVVHFTRKTLEFPRWRSGLSYVAAHKVEMADHDFTSGKCTLLLTGYVRACSLSVNQLVHVSGAGDYQLCKIEILKDPYPLNPRKGQDLMDADVQVIRTIMPDDSKQEPLLVENIPDPLAGEQTWPTEAEMADAEGDQKQKKITRRKLPPGTSEYQAAWILNDSDEDDFGGYDEDKDGMVLNEEESGMPFNKVCNKFNLDENQGSLDLGDSDAETETDSVMVDTENTITEQIEDDIKQLKDAHAVDEEFPEEVDTPSDVPARKRFAKYRGLKSFRTSPWDPKESLPQEYARIFAFDNFVRTKKHVLAKALQLDKESDDDTIAPGTYARLYINEVPSTVASNLSLRANTMPIVACGLLQHESKVSVLHFSIRKHDSYTEPIKAKDELVFHVGFRQFVARPIFSTDNINSDKHKMERFLHPGQDSVASIYAPTSFRPLNLIAMKNVGDSGSPVIAAVGSFKDVDPDRIILKKIILTGYPRRVSKAKATVRYMFNQPEDVRWLKPVEVWTKRGRRGHIKEPVGTHGAMKCVFNGILQQHDTVCMSLYKRVYPKWPEHKFPLC